MKKTLTIILVVFFTVLGFLYTNKINANPQQELTPIMGESQATKEQAIQMLKSNSNKSDEYINDFVNTTWEEATKEGVRPDVAFSLMMLETGWLKFGGDVKEDQNNFGGLGANGGGNPGHSFPDMATGIRAVVQHLKAYASSEPLQSECVDPRFKYVTRGSAQYVEWLGIRENPEGFGWASDFSYGYKIKNIMNRMTGKPTLPIIEKLEITGSYPSYSITATCNDTCQYKFVVLDTATNKETVIQNYNNSNKVTWKPNKPSDYKIFAYVKKTGSQYDFDSFTTCKIARPSFIVVLDAGHGGIDPGAISSPATGSLREADLNEQLTRILGGLLEEYGLTVIYTRDVIEPLSSPSQEAKQKNLHDRVNVANNIGADLFLSIHHNAFENKSAKGTETYYSTNNQNSEVVEKSKALAKQIVNKIASLGFDNRGAKDSNFVVVKYTTMPAVLIEVGFMTNDEEVLRLAKPEIQRSIAQTIATTVIEYFNLLEHLPITSSKYTIKNNIITGLSTNLKVSTFISNINVPNGTTIQLISSNGKAKTSGVIATGDKLQLRYKDSGSVYRTYDIVIYGDINGDGNITIIDLLRIQKHLLKTIKLSGAYLTAGDVSKDGAVTILDLLRVQKHLLGTAKIQQ